jgi:uncharacterized protein YbjT (DUF2867 family)
VPYLRLKATAEDLVRQSGVPYSIVAATQFYWLMDRMLGRMGRLRVLPLHHDAADAARGRGRLRGVSWSRCVADGPRGDRQPFGGPQVMNFGEIAGASTRPPGGSSAGSCLCRSPAPLSARPPTSPARRPPRHDDLGGVAEPAFRQLG